MKTFILGYIDTDTTDAENPSHLKIFNTKEQADLLADEWCEVKANNLAEALLKYHHTFTEWQKQIGGSNGSM